MKLLVSLVFALLLITCGAGSYYILNMNRQLDDMRVEIDESLNRLDTGFRHDLASRNQDIATEIDRIGLSLTRCADDLETEFAALDDRNTSNAAISSEVWKQQNKLGKTFDDTSGQLYRLYQEVKDSVVTISDGVNVIGSGCICTLNFMRANRYNSSIVLITSCRTIINNPGVARINILSILARRLYLTLSNGLTLRGFVNYYSESADIALIVICIENPEDYQLISSKSVKLADSSSVKPGDPVFLVNNPDAFEDNKMNLRDSLNTGIVSQVNRSIELDGDRISNLIQFDAPVNFGDSGGPVFNMDGEVIGIVNARINPLLGDGISFAVASNQINNIETTITTEGPNQVLHRQFLYPWTGITAEDISPKDVFAANKTVTSVVRVAAVASPAGDADIKVNDIILKLDDTPVQDAGEFYSFILDRYAPGDTVTLEILRDGETLTVPLTITKKYEALWPH